MDVDLYQREAELSQELIELTDKLPETGRELAEASASLDLLYGSVLAYYMDAGLSATAAKERAKYDPQVVEARKKRDLAEVMSKYNLESVNTVKLTLRVVEAQIQRAMASPNVGVGSF